MKKYNITLLQTDKYSAVVSTKTNDVALSYLDEIEADLNKRKVEGHILIDQLSALGDGPKRYLCANMRNGVLILENTQIQNQPGYMMLNSDCIYDPVKQQIIHMDKMSDFEYNKLINELNKNK